MTKNPKKSRAARKAKHAKLPARKQPQSKPPCYARKRGSGMPAPAAKEHEVLVPLEQELVSIPRSPVAHAETLAHRSR